MELIDSYKGWLIERVSQLKSENAAIAGGLRLAFRREGNGAWEDCTSSVREANDELILRMEGLVVSIEEEVDDNRASIGP